MPNQTTAAAPLEDSPAFIAECNVPWHRLSLWWAAVSCPPVLSLLTVGAEWDAQKPGCCESSLWPKHWSTTDTAVVTNLEHSTIQAAMKKISSIPASSIQCITVCFYSPLHHTQRGRSWSGLFWACSPTSIIWKWLWSLDSYPAAQDIARMATRRGW